MALNYDLNNTGPEVQERLDQVPENTQDIATEEQRAKQAEHQLDERLKTVEELAQISIDGGTIGIASPQDFDDPTPEQKATFFNRELGTTIGLGDKALCKEILANMKKRAIPVSLWNRFRVLLVQANVYLWLKKCKHLLKQG